MAGLTVDHGSAADDQPSAVMGCITAIPICGGFCADTQSPETGCLRHFSNETTPPQPCLKRYACRRFWEHSPWCRGIGRVGAAFGDRNRGYIMLSAFAVSFVAWILTFAAFAATSSQAGMIRDTCWAKSTATFSPTLHPPLGATVTSYVGIGSRVDVIDTPGEASTTSVVEWSTPGSCTLLNGVSYPRCEQCGAKSQEALQWLITSAITQVFQMTTDLQRTTRYGDLNCQKALGTLTGIYGTVATMQSLKAFMYECAGRGPEEYFRHRVEYLLPVPAEAANASSVERVAVEIRGGPGFALLLLATLLKLYDVACHASVPTPLPKREAAAHGLGLQEYMQRSREETRFGRVVVADSQALLPEPRLQAAQSSTEARRLPPPHPRAGASGGLGLQGEGAQGARDVPVQVRLPGVELGRRRDTLGGTLQAGAGGDGAVAKAEAAAAAAAKAEAERVAAAEEAAEAAAVAAEAERVAAAEAAEAAAEAAAAAEAEAERVAAAEEEAAAKEAEAEAERFAAAEAEAAAAEAERVAAVAAAKAEAERVAAAEAAEAAAKEAEAKRAAAESRAAREAG